MSVEPSLLGGVETVRNRIAGAIKSAATATGASFEYLLSAARIESNLDPGASASTSSARGLYQFIEQTWLGTVKEAGSSFGLGKYSDAITKSPSGTYSVSDPAMRDEILKLRDDPALAAAMAGVLTQSNSFRLTGALGRRPTDGELYIAHFMGVGGAAKLIASAEDTPNASAAAVFPNAASANRSIFYARDGRARSVSEVYSVLTSRYDSVANSPATRLALASAGAAGSGTGAAVPDTAAYLASFPQARSATSGTQQVAALQQSEPMFRSLFQTGDRAEPVSPAVRALWGANASSNAAQGAAAARPFDLFSDPNGTFSG